MRAAEYPSLDQVRRRLGGVWYFCLNLRIRKNEQHTAQRHVATWNLSKNASMLSM